MQNILTRRAVTAGLLAAGMMPAAAQNRPPRFETASRQFTEVSPSRPMPPLRLRALDGAMRDIAPAHGGVTLINFWATWCPACVNEMPILQRLHQSRRAHVIAISVDREGGRERVSRYLEKLKVTQLPIYLDPDGVAAYTDRENARRAPFALYGMPISYIIDRDNRVAGYFAGEADWLSADASRLLAHYGGARR